MEAINLTKRAIRPAAAFGTGSCNNLTDFAVAALANDCPQLTNVDFGGCQNLTDVALVALANTRARLWWKYSALGANRPRPKPLKYTSGDAKCWHTYALESVHVRCQIK